MIPQEFWLAIANDLHLITIGLFLWFASKAYYYAMKAHQKVEYNTFEITYQNCDVYPDKMGKWREDVKNEVLRRLMIDKPRK